MDAIKDKYKDGDIVTVLLSNGEIMSFDIMEHENMPFTWGAGYTMNDLNTLCGLYLSHDLLDVAEIYTKPDWAMQHNY